MESFREYILHDRRYEKQKVLVSFLYVYASISIETIAGNVPTNFSSTNFILPFGSKPMDTF